MGVELELATLLVIQTIGMSVFSAFEVETPWWRSVLKWTLVAVVTVLVYGWAGHWALLAAVVPALGGAVVHFSWCRRHGIHPTRATPRRRYYELRGWSWPE